MGISTGTGSRRPWGAVGGPLVPLLPASPHPTLPLGFTRSNAEPPAPLSSPPQLPEPPMPHTPGSGVWRGLAGTATPGPPTNPVPGVPRSWGGSLSTPARHGRVMALPGERRQEAGPMCWGQKGLRDSLIGAGSAGSQPGPVLPCPRLCLGCPNQAGEPREELLPPWIPLPGLPGQAFLAGRVGAAPGWGGPGAL